MCDAVCTFFLHMSSCSGHMKEYIRLIPVAGLQINIYLCTAFFLSAALHADTLPDCGKEGKK
ncbi:MAG: hypothetical protein BHV84_09610 [Prevotella sp. AG:487_50_53]|nr:MAG: hypothetical protein BHV84_09610 [Prevotella sp. AG:487_50_53]